MGKARAKAVVWERLTRRWKRRSSTVLHAVFAHAKGRSASPGLEAPSTVVQSAFFHNAGGTVLLRGWMRRSSTVVQAPSSSGMVGHS